jgi:hypothetical protein
MSIDIANFGAYNGAAAAAAAAAAGLVVNSFSSPGVVVDDGIDMIRANVNGLPIKITSQQQQQQHPLLLANLNEKSKLGKVADSMVMHQGLFFQVIINFSNDLILALINILRR